MLINLEVAFIVVDSCFILFHSLVKVTLLFIKETNLDQCVGLSLQSESVCQDRVLEIADSLLNLVSFSKDHA